MIKKLCCFCAAILSLCSQVAFSANEYRIIPYPQEVEYGEGILRLKQPIRIYASEFPQEGALLETYLNKDFQAEAALSKSKKKSEIVFSLNPKLAENQYQITVNKKHIEVEAVDAEAAFYAVQTLRQMFEKENGSLSVQQGVIRDYPAFSWRSFMLDEGRHFKGKDVVKQLLDNMALLKMNVFHWHLTDDQGWRVEIKKYPLLTEVGSYRDSTEINHFHSNIYDGKPHSGYYTQEDIREIVAYATERHIQIVPEIDMPGHASSAIAAYPWLGVKGESIKVPCYFGVHYNLYDVSNPAVHQFLGDVVDELIELFPGSVIHIGGDEVRYNHWNDSEAVQAYMSEKGIHTPAELQVHFTNAMSEMIRSKNKRMMGWNEITGEKIHDYQQENGGKQNSEQKLAEGTIVQFWNGNPSLIENTARNGYDIVNSFHEYTYLDYTYESIPLEKAYKFSPIPTDLPEELKGRIIGIGCQMWGEFIPTVESMNRLVYPRIAAYAETGWSGDSNKDYERFQQNLNQFLTQYRAAFPVID